MTSFSYFWRLLVFLFLTFVICFSLRLIVDVSRGGVVGCQARWEKSQRSWQCSSCRGREGAVKFLC